MYKVYFYHDRRGRSPVKDYIDSLIAKNDKESRIKLNKIREYIKILSEYGLSAGEPYMKHIKDGIWELRPMRDRILFAVWDGDGFVLLHQFMKQTQKTPKNEIEKAVRNLLDYRERSHENENI